MIDGNYILKLIQIFIIYSFFGWILETVYKSIMQKKFINSGFLYGPFCPIYGFGTLIMYVCLKDFKSNILLVFIMSFVILSIWEYLVGLFLELVFKTKYWDYSYRKFNIQGRVCLFNSTIWGLLGVLFIEIAHPVIEGYLNYLDQDIFTIITLIIFLYIVIDAIISAFKVAQINSKIQKLGKIKENITEKLLELKNLNEDIKNKPMNRAALQEKIEELKYQETKLKRKLLRQINRLRKTFPTLKSDNISNFLKEKIEDIKNKRIYKK